MTDEQESAKTTRATRPRGGGPAAPCKGCAERDERIAELGVQFGASLDDLETRSFAWIGAAAAIGLVAAAIAVIALARTRGGE